MLSLIHDTPYRTTVECSKRRGARVTYLQLALAFDWAAESLDVRDASMDKKSKWNSKSNFLDSIPSQLRYAYLALKKKQDAKPSQLRDGDKDLQEVISGHNFGYLSFEKICKNEFEPEDCFLQFDAVSCELLLESTTSEVKRNF